MRTRESLTRPLAVVLTTAAVCIGFAVALLANGSALPDVGARYEVDAVVPSAVSLAPGAEVRIASVRAGEVEDIRQRGSTAVLRLRFDDDQPVVHRDAQVSVRLRTLVGENYVEVLPGSPGAPVVPDGGELPAAQALEATQIDEILAVLDTRTRARARVLLRGAGAGVRGRGDDLNTLVDGLSATITEAAPVTRVLDAQRRQIAGVVGDLGAIMREIARRGTELRRFATTGRETAVAVAERDRALRATLARAPSALRAVRRVSQTLTQVTRSSAPAIAELASTVRGADRTLRLLRPAADTATAAVTELRRASPPLRRLLPALRRFAPVAGAAMEPLRGVLRQVNPMLRYLAPYVDDVAAVALGLRSATTYYDATGNSARVQVTMNELSPTLFDGPTLKAMRALYDTGILTPVRRLGQNAYPAPRSAAEPREFDGAYPRVGPDR